MIASQTKDSGEAAVDKGLPCKADRDGQSPAFTAPSSRSFTTDSPQFSCRLHRHSAQPRTRFGVQSGQELEYTMTTADPGMPLPPLSGEIHVWIVALDATDEVLSHLTSLLSSDEAERVRRFAFAQHGRSFSISRGALRIVLSQYLSTRPADIRFAYSDAGKPRLAHAATDLRFNCSHSNGIAVYSVAIECDVGIDVEQIRPIEDIEAIAQAHFCAEETSYILSQPAGCRQTAFFRCWTRKEAVVKAIGEGLAIPLRSFRVSLNGEREDKLIDICDGRGSAHEWQLHEIVPAPGYICALAYRDSRRRLRINRCMSPIEILA
jgi:4'-phosphopantetheinyl transferase